MRGNAKTVPDELRDLGRELRQGAGRELRAEAATDEELTELQRRRRLDLAAAMRNAMHRGDRVTATVGGLTLSHPLISVGSDYLTMTDGSGVFDVRLDAATLTVDPRPAGGASGRPASPTFRARLAELEQEAGEVEVVTAQGERVAGRLDVTAADHIVVADVSGSMTYLPYEEVVVVFSRFPPRPG